MTSFRKDPLMPHTPQTSIDDRWISYPAAAPDAPVRLFCLPYAGGGSSVYRQWPAALPDVEVATVELPGRETRLDEPAIDAMGPLVTVLADAIVPHLDRPYAVFGHSMGARISFELVRELRRRGAPAPVVLFVSACKAPHIPRVPTPAMSSLPDKVFTGMLRQFSGTPPEVFDDPELFTFLLPVLRADFTIIDTYEYADERALPCPIRAFGGISDPEVPEDALLGWQSHTSSSFRMRRIPGDHFIIRSRQRELTEAITADLTKFAGR
jgi:medium-chain acyl-[acyl-carrier-protein] hydrolase